MNSFYKFTETGAGETKLSEFMKDRRMGPLDYKILDKPILHKWGQKNGESISFGSAEKAEKEMKEARRQAAEAKQRTALARIDTSKGHLSSAEHNLKWAAEAEKKSKEAEAKAKKEMR